MGKSLQPLKATAVRQPATTPAAVGPAANPASNEPVTAESLGWQLRAALPALRLHSVSLWDEQANTLWLSEGALGPDEHNVVLEAIEALGRDTSLNCYETGIEDGPVAIFLPVRSPIGGLVGLAMILADIKSVNDGVLDKLASTQIRTIMQRVAVLLRPAQSRLSQTESLKVLELAPEVGEESMAAKAAVSTRAMAGASTSANAATAAPVASAQPAALISALPGALTSANAAGPASAKLAGAASARAAAPVLSPEAVDDILEFELTPDVPVAAAAPSQTQRLRAVTQVNGGDLELDLPIATPAIAKAAPSTPPKLAGAAPVTTIDFAPTLDVVPTSSPAIIAAGPSASLASIAPVLTASPAAAVALVAAAAPVAAVDDNVAQFSSAAAVPANVPVAAPAAQTPSNATWSAPNSSSSMTSRTLTGSAKALNSTQTAKSLSTTSTAKVIALPEGVNLILEVLPYSKLRSGGRSRRFEVIPRSSQPNRAPPGFDKIALQQLLVWMGSNRAAWSLEPTSFTINLSISTLEDDRFPQFVASNLKANGIAPDNIGFEIAEPLCIQRRAQVERFITLCDKLGCFVVIDDFSLDSSVTSLLRSRALRLVKIDPKLTSVALKDKLAQAMVVATAQAVKVLGIHCSAKRVDTQASLQWLTAIGVDFAQGAALAPVQALESLGSQAVPAPPAG
jgi:EAL domain-containing protein (putative c-di-GMP-specific phosphodiesterase class I)